MASAGERLLPVDLPPTVTLKHLTEILSVSKPTIMALVAARKFPAPLRLSGRLYRWETAAVRQHLADVEAREVAHAS